jgi:AcrR family transcriptional regulator
MDAAEHLLYEVGYAGVTTRTVAEAAGVRPGLVHYYFGSMEELLTQTLERFVDQLASAVDALYADPTLSFAEKWRLGSQFWVEEPTSHFPKVLMELLAVGWNLPALKARLTGVHARFRAVFEDHFGRALRHYGLDENEYPLKVIVAAVTSFQLGLIVEGLSDVHEGHQELLDWIQRWVDGLEAGAAGRPKVARPDPAPALPAGSRRGPSRPAGKRRQPGA